MPRKAMKCIVEFDIHTVLCPGTYLRDYGYIYLRVSCMGLDVSTKAVPPTFPLFFHERLRFERTFKNCQDPAYVSVLLKGEDLTIELKQHDDYISDGYVIAHYSSNVKDFLYPTSVSSNLPGRDVTLYKTSLFNPIRITGEPVRLEFATKTTLKEVPDPNDFSKSTESEEEVIPYSNRPKSSSNHRSRSPHRLCQADETIHNNSEFVVRHKDDKLLENRDFSTFINPKPRRSRSPTRRSRSLSPSKRLDGNATSQSIPAWKYSVDFPRSSETRRRPRHSRSATEPASFASSFRSPSPSRSLRFALDDLDITSGLSRSFTDATLRHKTRYSPHLSAALSASDRIQSRVDRVMRVAQDSDTESVDSLDVLRDSLREERKALSDAIREADRKAYYKSLGIDL
ncbi:serine/arginine repetitive matrix protein 1-like isoform X1 [Dendronephthya gigantea]|uniref:serine/arginine repetitive matrix protein 1-like isoform X1 n=1 Tax=Dendronephthya gigantea TaxID=151771 RepID=UPI00106979F2|nr:serine/arginine repetitive matrix protein 1-like isoform X1 [Dendronephthya gigantea]